MRRIVISALVSLLLASTALWGADFWEEKEYSQWTDKELQKMMMNSPWAKQVLVSRGGGGGSLGLPGQAGGGARGGGRGGGGGGGGGGGRGGGGGGRGGGGGGGGQAGPPPMQLWVRWNSAVPLKQGIVRNQTGMEGEANPDQVEFLGREEPNYIVSVSGLPAQMARLAQNTERLKGAAMLERKKMDPIMPEAVEVQESQSGLTIYFMFPRSAGIDVADKEVEFVLKLAGGGGGRGGGQGAGGGGEGRGGGGQGARGGGGGGRGGGGFAGGLDVKKKFKLKDMLYKGELSL